MCIGGAGGGGGGAGRRGRGRQGGYQSSLIINTLAVYSIIDKAISQKSVYFGFLGAYSSNSIS